MAKPSKKATIITVAIIIVLLIVAIVAVAVFLRDKGSTEAAGIQSEQNENSQTQTAQEPSDETQSASEGTSSSGASTLGDLASDATQQSSNGGTTQDQSAQSPTSTGTTSSTTSNAGRTSTSVASTATGSSTSDETTTSTENIQDSTITRTETVEIPERKVSEDHNVWWEPMSINALLVSAMPSNDDIVDVEKTGDAEVPQGEAINYTIKVTNNTDKKLEGIEVKDELPNEVDPDSIEFSEENMFEARREGNIVKWNVDIEPNGYVELKFSVKVRTNVPEDTEIKNSAIANGKRSDVITTTVDKATKSLPVSKKIVAGDSDAAKAYPITGVVVTLDGTDKTLTLNEENNYSGEFSNLDRYDENGNEITYTVSESAIDGEGEAFTHYKQDESKGEGQFVNTFDPSTVQDETTELSVHKDIITNNSDAAKVYSISGVVVTLEGTDKEPITLNETNNYTGKFTGLKKYDENGNLIKYNAVESAIDGEGEAFAHYKQDESKGEGQFINTFDPSTLQEDKTSVTVNKTWDDMNNEHNTRPENGIIVHLKDNNGKTLQTVTITESDNWTYTFADLNKYDANGNIINYTVEEEQVNNYNYPPEYKYNDNKTECEIVNRADIDDASIDKTVTGYKVASSEDSNKVETDVEAPTVDKTTGEKTYDLGLGLGDTIIYDIKVNNDGNTELTNVKVTDDKAVTIIGLTPIDNGENGDKVPKNITTEAGDNLFELAVGSDTLAVGKGYIFTVSYTLEQDDIADVSKVVNTATVDSEETNPEYSKATVTTNVEFAHELTKEIMSVSGRDVEKPETTTENSTTIVKKYDDVANKGETIKYKIKAENKGTTTIEQLKLTDNRNVYVESVKFSNQDKAIKVEKAINSGENILANDTYKLAPGETVEVIVTYVIGSMDEDNTNADTLKIVNTTDLEGKAFDPTANDPNNKYQDVEDKAKAEITATMKSNITVKKESTTNGNELQPGEKIKYTVTLKNNSPVDGTAKVTESIPDGTTLVGSIKVDTSKAGTNNPKTLSSEQIEAMSKGDLELTVPGNGNVVITFTVEVQNSAIATTVENEAKINTNGEDKTSEKINNRIKKALNIYETKTELGKQSVVIVVDMTLSLAAGVDTDNIDRLAYAPLNNDGSVNYKAGYENTRWFALKTALDSFIDSYLGENPGNKKSVAIVGFCNGIVLKDTGFMTNAETAKGKYAKVFTQEQYTAAVKYAEDCKDKPKKMKELFDKNDTDLKTEFKVNKNGTYDIDVDILQFIKATGYTKEECGLGSGTNIASGLEKGNELVNSQTKKNIPTDLIVITDGENNKGDKSDIPDEAKKIMSHEVDGEYSKLYAIGFTKDSSSFKELLKGNMTEYYSATDTSSLNTAFKDIVEDTVKNPDPNTIWATTETDGWVSLEDISFASNSVITLYTGDAESVDSTTIVKYNSLQEFKKYKYYDESKGFNLKQFLIDYNVGTGKTVNMQVYTKG